jgi:hypothetical protein
MRFLVGLSVFVFLAEAANVSQLVSEYATELCAGVNELQAVSKLDQALVDNSVGEVNYLEKVCSIESRVDPPSARL